MTGKIRITQACYEQAREHYQGICKKCHNVQETVEPDARNYLCEDCQKEQVFGIEELLIEGSLEFIEDLPREEQSKYRGFDHAKN